MAPVLQGTDTSQADFCCVFVSHGSVFSTFKRRRKDDRRGSRNPSEQHPLPGAGTGGSVVWPHRTVWAAPAAVTHRARVSVLRDLGPVPTRVPAKHSGSLGCGLRGPPANSSELWAWAWTSVTHSSGHGPKCSASHWSRCWRGPALSARPPPPPDQSELFEQQRLPAPAARQPRGTG